MKIIAFFRINITICYLSQQPPIEVFVYSFVDQDDLNIAIE